MDQSDSRQRRGSLLHAFKSVLWAMFGVRRSGGHEEDARRVTAGQAIAVGLIAMTLFVLVLYFVVRLVLALAGA